MELPISGESVPVFDCHVLLRETSTGVTARTANLDGIEATGPTERDVLMAIVKTFKQTVQALRADGKPIPFREQPLTPEEDEVERWIPVHL